MPRPHLACPELFSPTSANVETVCEVPGIKQACGSVGPKVSIITDELLVAGHSFKVISVAGGGRSGAQPRSPERDPEREQEYVMQDHTEIDDNLDGEVAPRSLEQLLVIIRAELEHRAGTMIRLKRTVVKKLGMVGAPTSGLDEESEPDTSAEELAELLADGVIVAGDPRTKGIERSNLVANLRAVSAEIKALNAVLAQLQARHNSIERFRTLEGTEAYSELWGSLDGFFIVEFHFVEPSDDEDRSFWRVKFFSSDEEGTNLPPHNELATIDGSPGRNVDIKAEITRLIPGDTASTATDGLGLTSISTREDRTAVLSMD